MKQIARAAERRARPRSALCREEGPACDKACERMHELMPVFVGASAHGMSCGELRARETVRSREESGEDHGERNARARDARRDTEAQKNARTEDGAEPQKDCPREPDHTPKARGLVDRGRPLAHGPFSSRIPSSRRLCQSASSASGPAPTMNKNTD